MRISRETVSVEERGRIRQLLSYLPFFERPGLEIGGARAEWEQDVLKIYPAEYVDEVYAFFSLLVPPYIDTEYLNKPVNLWLQNPAFIENASPRQLRAVLTWLCRGERFCLGFWEEQFKNGNLVRTLRRLRSLLDANFRFDLSASKKVEQDASAYPLPERELIKMEVADPDENPPK
jgi:hypothetical protein